MGIDQKQFWDDSSSFFSIQTKSNKEVFNRRTLKKYFSIYNEYDQVNKDTFFTFFDENSLSLKDEQSGCYLSHLLYLDGYVMGWNNIEELLFDNGYLSPGEINDKGQLYIDCLFQSNVNGYSQTAINTMKAAMQKYSLRFNEHTDFSGNTIAHWLLVSTFSRYYKSFFPFFDRYLLYRKNKNGISVYNLKELSYSLAHNDGHYEYLEMNEFLVLKRFNHNIYQIISERFFLKDEVLSKFLNNEKYKDIDQYFPSFNDFKDNSFDTFSKSLKK